MSEYQIYPDGVRTVLASLQEPFASLQAGANAMPGFDANLAAAIDELPYLTSAITAFLSTQMTEVVAMSNTLAAGSLGATSATNSYIAGDEEMSAAIGAAESAAVSAAVDGNFDALIPAES